MIYHVFDLENSFFEAGFFMLFIGMLYMSFCMMLLWKENIKSRTLRTAILFYGINAVGALVFREYLLRNTITECLMLSMGVGAVAFAWHTHREIAIDIFYRRKLHCVLSPYVK